MYTLPCLSLGLPFTNNGDFKIQRRGRQRERQKTIGLISNTTTSHVHHTFLYISFPFLHDYEVKMPNFKFYGERKQATTKFYFSFWAWICSLEIQLQEGSPTIDRLKTQIHFLSDVLVAVVSLDLKVPKYTRNTFIETPREGVTGQQYE